MGISDHLIIDAIGIIADTDGIIMDPDALLDDIVLIAYVFDKEAQFKTAITQVKNAMLLIVKTRNIGQKLRGNLSNWNSFHFQSERTKKHPADLRIIYQETGTDIKIRGFGHRHLPSNVYHRLYSR